MPAANANAWAAQTVWLSDKTYSTDTPGIWQTKVTRSDRRCQLTDNELKRHRGGARVLADGYGNLPPATTAEAARIAVERAMGSLSPSQRAAISPRMKWELVAQVEAVQQQPTRNRA
jgi:hypothetical protein